MGISDYKGLSDHVGHKIECVYYGNPHGKGDNVALECVDCNEVLMDFDKPPKMIKLSKDGFEVLIISNLTDYGFYLEVEYNGCKYGQSYKRDVSLKDATERFIKFYYPLYVIDFENSEDND